MTFFHVWSSESKPHISQNELTYRLLHRPHCSNMGWTQMNWTEPSHSSRGRSRWKSRNVLVADLNFRNFSSRLKQAWRQTFCRPRKPTVKNFGASISLGVNFPTSGRKRWLFLFRLQCFFWHLLCENPYMTKGSAPSLRNHSPPSFWQDSLINQSRRRFPWKQSKAAVGKASDSTCEARLTGWVFDWGFLQDHVNEFHTLMPGDIVQSRPKKPKTRKK